VKKRLTVISPVFNEVEVIESFYRELKVCLRGLASRYDAEILLVLDRCTDDTVSVVRHLAADDFSLRCLVLSSRFGHQMSLLAGLDHAKADLYVMMDSDLQHPPSLIPEMIRAYEEGFDVVYTVRRESGRQPAWRRLAGKVFYGLLHRVSDAPIYENAADFRLLTDKVARVFRTDIRERKMFMRGLISWVGFNQKRLEYSAATRRAGASKYSMSRMTGLAADAVLSFSTFPLKVSLALGAAMSAAGFAYAFFTAIQFGISSRLPSGWATLVMLITIFAGAQLLCLGLVGAYVGAIYAEVKKRPHYIVDETINFPRDMASVTAADRQASA
jgi:glycosyltransferase involved in cell wall biosynthesis